MDYVRQNLNKLGNNHHLWSIEELFHADLGAELSLLRARGEAILSESDLSVVAVVANVCPSCWFQIPLSPLSN